MPDFPPTLPVDGHARLRLALPAGRVTVHAEPRDTILLERGFESRERRTIEKEGWLVLQPDRNARKVEIRVPEGTDLAIGTASGRIEIEGNTGALRLTTASGRIEVEAADKLDARSKSGAVEIGRAAEARVQTASGNITIGKVRKVMTATVSGRTVIEEVEVEARVRAASGRIDVGIEGSAAVVAESLSGAITVTVPSGCRPETRLRTRSGRPAVEVAPGHDCQIMGRSLSGRIRVAER